ncbi:MAG: putative manganese transporter [Nitrosopumilus sp.]|uniref:hypothetical protein n=1 Tax=Nitrosopumilus sp. TaxID=2024843 RepID=UPI00243225FE|nr:hypothetical protein [Nitrosopumilus sp.]MCV0366366.1 putative manganese transporter [Nitrosopumilus sp.]
MSQDPSSDTKENNGESKSDGRRSIDWFQFIIAMVVVVSFTIFEGMVIWGNPKFDESFQIISMTAPFVGTIIGFYFGQRPVQTLTNEVSKANTAKNDLGREYGDTLEKTYSAQEELKQVKKDMENLKRLFGV